MRCVYTIRQHVRTVLPDIFINRILPLLREIHEVKAILIQHKANPFGSDLTQQGIDRVTEKTKAGLYNGAEIITHEEIFPSYPSLPSFRIAFEAALRERAEYHYFLEDDSLILDARTPVEMRGFEVGSYRHDFVRTAYGVCRTNWCRTVLKRLEPTWLDIKAPLYTLAEKVPMGEGARVFLGTEMNNARLEGFLTNLCHNQFAKMPIELAGRVHPTNTPVRPLITILGEIGVASEVLDEDFTNWRGYDIGS